MVLRRLKSAAISAARQKWAVEQVLLAAKASHNLGLSAHATFSGALAWPFVYPWPQRPEGLVETAFDELARRWTPILNAFDEAGVDLCYEIHPGEDLHDGITFEMFLERVNNHRRCNILYDPSHFLLQQLDYLQFIDMLSSAYQDVSRQGRRVQPERPAGRLFRIPAVGELRRAFPLAGRRAGGVRCDLLQAVAIRILRLGGTRMGVLSSRTASKARRKAHHLSRLTSSRLPAALSTTSRPAASTRRPTVSCRDWADDPSDFCLGMVGGGEGAFIGAVHRIAARMDDQYEFVAGALSSDPARAHASAAALHIEPGRRYAGFEEMAEREAARPDRIDVVAIVTPNHLHFAAGGRLWVNGS